LSRDYKQAYFENPETWDSVAWQGHAGDAERARLAAEWLPADAHSILDVGCGNGVFANLREIGRSKVGLDRSKAALGHITTPRIQADAARLPLISNKFDACVSMEMLEHLPEPSYHLALNELTRVARKYLLITVPYKEKLKHNTVICPNCKLSFHPYHHLREYQEKDLLALFGSRYRMERLEAVVQTSRPALPGLWNLIRVYQHRNGKNYPAMVVCSRCGYSAGSASSTHKEGRGRVSLLKKMRLLWPMRRTYIWWMALYRKAA
jgi:SAM-dependent methyltransferase